MFKHVKNWLIGNAMLAEDASDQKAREVLAKALEDGRITMKKCGELMDEADGPTPAATSSLSSKQVFSGQIQGVAPSARYKDVKYLQKHARTGLPVKGPNGRDVESLSERELAKCGAFFKLAMKKNGVPVELKEHEQQLIDEMYATDTWAGEIGGVYHKEINGMRVKASLLEDTTSGGTYVTPYWWDDAIVTFPLLFGELFPYVELVDMPTSQEVRTASLQNPQVSWGTYSGTSMTEFDNTALIGDIDAFVAPCTYATEISRDLLADTAVSDLGGRVVQTVGMAAMKEMDRVVAVGSGTNQPQGIFNQSSPTVLNSANGVGGPMVLSDFEGLLFSIPKQYRSQMYRCAFYGNDQSYYHARSMPIGPNDSRRVLGQDENSYSILSWPWRVCNDIPANQIGFGALARYRMWRRQGQEVRLSDVGATLMLKNTLLIVVRSRYAGQVIDSNGFVQMNDAATVG